MSKSHQIFCKFRRSRFSETQPSPISRQGPRKQSFFRLPVFWSFASFFLIFPTGHVPGWDVTYLHNTCFKASKFKEEARKRTFQIDEKTVVVGAAQKQMEDTPRVCCPSWGKVVSSSGSQVTQVKIIVLYRFNLTGCWERSHSSSRKATKTITQTLHSENVVVVPR